MLHQLYSVVSNITFGDHEGLIIFFITFFIQFNYYSRLLIHTDKKIFYSIGISHHFDDGCAGVMPNTL